MSGGGRTKMLKICCLFGGLSLLAAVSVPAAGDEFCDTLRSITKLAPQGFEPLKGKEGAFGIVEAKIALSGANSCTIGQDEYSCSWDLTSSEALEPSARALAKSIQVCHPGAKYTEEVFRGDYWFEVKGDKLKFTINTDQGGTVTGFLGAEETVHPYVYLTISVVD